MASLLLCDGGLTTTAPAGNWLESTAQIDHDSVLIRDQVARLTRGAQTDRERALRIYRFVRDEIRFGWQTAFYDVKASDVLRSRIGYCQTKGTLFVAMLRAAKIPARLHFVDLRSDVLAGLVQTGAEYVDHAYAEVWLAGRWVGIDSYVVDRPLYEQAMRNLEAEGLQLGYGVHRQGISVWDGWNDSFVQFVDDGSVPWLAIKDHGVYTDVREFYESVPNTYDKLTPMRSLALRLFLPVANRRIARLRARHASGTSIAS